MTDGDSQPLVSRLTAPIPAGIATLVVRGVSAIEEAVPLLGLRTQTPELGRVYFGAVNITSGQEHAVVCLTEPDVLEIHCHGGRAVSQAILDILGTTSAQVAAPDDYLRQVASLVQYDARCGLIAAQTDRAAAYMLDQVNGALESAIERLIASLSSRNVPGALQLLCEMEAQSTFADRLIGGWDVVIAGPPNVGKSSLLNAIVGRQRSIVNPEAGTTRDWVEDTTAIDGWPIRVSDTAGVRSNAGSIIESEGIAFAQDRIREADIVLIVVDLTKAWTDVHSQIVKERIDAPKKGGSSGAQDASKIVCLANKADLVSEAELSEALHRLGEAFPQSPPIVCSCLVAGGVDEAIQRIASIISSGAPPEGVPLASSPPLQARIRDAIAELNAGNTKAATAILSHSLEKPRAN